MLAVGGMFMVRKRISSESRKACHEVGGVMLAIVGTLYAIVVGLIVVSSQAKVDTAKQMAITEANMLSNIYHLAKTFKDPTRHNICQAVYEYSVIAVDQDWSAIEEGKIKEGTIPSYQKIWHEVTHYNPADGKESACYSTMISNIEELSAARRFRMVSAKSNPSPVLWSVLVAGGVLIVLFTYFFCLESLLAQTIMTAFVAIFLSMNVCVIYICQNPYRAELGAKEAGFGFSFDTNWFKEPPQVRQDLEQKHEK